MNPSFRSALIIVAAFGAVSVSHAADSKPQRGGNSCASGRGAQKGGRHKPLMAVGAIGMVSGLMSGDMLVGIDFRVQEGMLYSVSKAGGVYQIDTATAAATKVSQLTVALDGDQVSDIAMPLNQH